MNAVPMTDAAVKRATLKLALQLLARLRKADAEYDEHVQFNARRGYRPNHCPHGYNLWVDYDVICPGCEDPNPPTNYKIALNAARATLREVVRRRHLTDIAINAVVTQVANEYNVMPSDQRAQFDIVSQFVDLGDMRDKMVEWVLAPFDMAHHRL